MTFINGRKTSYISDQIKFIPCLSLLITPIILLSSLLKSEGKIRENLMSWWRQNSNIKQRHEHPPTFPPRCTKPTELQLRINKCFLFALLSFIVFICVLVYPYSKCKISKNKKVCICIYIFSTYLTVFIKPSTSIQSPT